MRKYLLTTVAVLALCACSEQVEQSANDPTAGDIIEEGASKVAEGAENTVDVITDAVSEAVEEIEKGIETELEQADAQGLTALNLLGETVNDRNNRPVAEIADIALDENWKMAAFRLSEGGMFGLGEEPVLINAQRFELVSDENGEFDVKVRMSEAEIEQLAQGPEFLPSDFSMGTEIDASMLSAARLITMPVFNPQGEKVADIHDINMSQLTWAATGIVLSVGGISAVGDRLVEIPISEFSVDLLNDKIIVSTEIDFENAETFVYDKN